MASIRSIIESNLTIKQWFCDGITVVNSFYVVTSIHRFLIIRYVQNVNSWARLSPFKRPLQYHPDNSSLPKSRDKPWSHNKARIGITEMLNKYSNRKLTNACSKFSRIFLSGSFSGCPSGVTSRTSCMWRMYDGIYKKGFYDEIWGYKQDCLQVFQGQSLTNACNPTKSPEVVGTKKRRRISRTNQLRLTYNLSLTMKIVNLLLISLVP